MTTPIYRLNQNHKSINLYFFSEFAQTAWLFMGAVRLNMTELSITKKWFLLTFGTYSTIYNKQRTFQISISAKSEEKK